MDIAIKTGSPEKLQTGVLVSAPSPTARSPPREAIDEASKGKLSAAHQAWRPGGEGGRLAAPARPARRRRGAGAAGQPRTARRVRRQGVPRRARRRGQGARRRRGQGRGGDACRCRGARPLARLAPGAGRRLLADGAYRFDAPTPAAARRRNRIAGRAPSASWSPTRSTPSSSARYAAARRWPRAWPWRRISATWGATSATRPIWPRPRRRWARSSSSRSRCSSATTWKSSAWARRCRWAAPRTSRASSSSCTTGAARRRPNRSCWWARASPSIPAGSRSSRAPIWTR